MFLHDPEIKIDGIRLKPATKNSKTLSNTVKDTWYWPDMDRDEVFCTLDVYGLPDANQCYRIPSIFRYQSRHDQTLLSLWAHFVDECGRSRIRLYGEHNPHYLIEAGVEPDSGDLVNPYLGVNRRRLPIFVWLSNTPQFPKKHHSRIDNNENIEPNVKPRDHSMQKSTGLSVKTLRSPAVSNQLDHYVFDTSPRGVTDLHTPSPLPSDIDGYKHTETVHYSQSRFVSANVLKANINTNNQRSTYSYSPLGFDYAATPSSVPRDISVATYTSAWTVPAPNAPVKTNHKRYE